VISITALFVTTRYLDNLPRFILEALQERHRRWRAPAAGELAMIGGYRGYSDTFDKAIAAFLAAYTDQN